MILHSFIALGGKRTGTHFSLSAIGGIILRAEGLPIIFRFCQPTRPDGENFHLTRIELPRSTAGVRHRHINGKDLQR
jgi:hypothetical protein